MKIGFELTWGSPKVEKGAVSAVPGNSWWGTIKESFAGAWQRNVEVESRPNLLAFSAVYAAVSLIADDVSKLRIKLMEQSADGIWSEVTRNAPFVGVLTKPNAYQTRIQFVSQWVVSKLLYGNAYVYKEYDNRSVVRNMYCLDPRYVTALVDDEGGVWYQLHQDALNNVDKPATVPADRIIHDRCVTLFHPLMGVSPIYACGRSATQGLKIQANSSLFFENMSRPSGHLTAPGEITDPTAERLKKEFEKNFSGGNLGRLLVTGDGLKYEPMTIPAVDAQLIEQLKWTVEDVARCFRIPLYKIAGNSASNNFKNIGELNQDYYSQTLQIYIESIELLLDEGLGLVNVPDHTYGVELDTEELLRMDPLSRADRNERSIKAGYLTPNEARASENYKPITGGNSAYMQQQNYSLEALAKRDAREDPFGTAKPPVPALPAPAPAEPDQDEQAAKDLMLDVIAKFTDMSVAV